MSARQFLACDWGTTQLRAWVVDSEVGVLRHKKFPYGVSKLERGEARQKFYQHVRPEIEADDLPALLCGMIGSDLGWLPVPHQMCPADLKTLAAALFPIEENPSVWIVPGLRGNGISDSLDIMRGEETQILGWVAQDKARGSERMVVCHPGTHAKWALIEGGRIIRFITAMTGELLDLLRSHSVLRTDAPADDEAAFDEGVAAAADGGALAARLFTVRTRVVTGTRFARSSTSYLSGLLIGAEIASMPKLLGAAPQDHVNLLGDIGLCRWYARALAQRGMSATVHNGEDAVVVGLTRLKVMAGL